MLKPNLPWKSLFAAVLLLSGCATTVPDIEVCAGVTDIPGIAATCRNTNSDAKRRLTLDEWIDFLYAQPERPDPKNPGKKLPEKGPTIAISSDDYMKNDIALGKLCTKVPCKYEQKKEIAEATDRIKAVIKEATPKKKGK